MLVKRTTVYFQNPTTEQDRDIICTDHVETDSLPCDMVNELLEVGAFNLTRQLIELVLGIKPVVIDEKQNIIAVGVSTL